MVSHQILKSENVWKRCVLLHTAPCRCLCSLAPVWIKMTAFQIWILIYNSATMPLSTKYVLTTIKSLQMRYCMTFHLKGHQNYYKLELNVQKKTYFIKWIWKSKVWLLLFPMPLEIKHHKMLYLKALNSD